MSPEAFEAEIRAYSTPEQLVTYEKMMKMKGWKCTELRQQRMKGQQRIGMSAGKSGGNGWIELDGSFTRCR